MIKNLYFEDGSVVILDQSQLPDNLIYEKCSSPEELALAIKKMKVRGAPLIGVTAAYGMALALARYQGSRERLDAYFCDIKELLSSTRPTAVNLYWALERMEKVYLDNRGLDIPQISGILLAEAEKMYNEDLTINQAIGEYGQELLGEGVSIMTICNAGALATCGYGTALGVIRSAAGRNKLQQVWACETRPLLQGARLTVWELLQDNIPVKLITDNMAAYVMKLGNVDAVVVGADRIAANGDTANKIGTYSLALAARHHEIPFYVAAPLSTIDMKIASGEDIPIEERDECEVRQLQGQNLTVPAVEVFNPAFDVSPHELITAIISEKGITRPPFADGLKRLFQGSGE
jgi:methylthioribose-1-phosphate isomerase